MENSAISCISTSQCPGPTKHVVYRIDGSFGHRQRLAYLGSKKLTFADGVTVYLYAADVTGTYDYAYLHIEGANQSDAYNRHWIESQLTDGLWETTRYGAIEQVSLGKDLHVWSNAISNISDPRRNFVLSYPFVRA